MTPARPAIRYYGSKWRLSPWILQHFPPHTTYVEPFGGGAAVLLRKPPSTLEVYNDLSGDTVNFFAQLRDHTDALVRAIELTPYARAEFLQAISAPGSSALEQARRFYIEHQQGWGGRKSRPSWRYQHTNTRGKSVVADWNQVNHLYAIAGRLKQVFIECDDAVRVIERFDTPHTLFYLDPPYLPDTRSRFDHGYDHEMTDADHEALLQQIRGVAGMVVLSGYPSEMYNEYLADWDRVETTARTTHTPTIATEVLWLSPAVQAARMPLFQREA